MNCRVTVLALMLLACASCGTGEGGGRSAARGGDPEASQPAAPDASPAAMTSSDATAWSMPMPDESYNVRQGRALFQHYCAICHGEAGRGDGFNAYNLDPKPRNLAEPGFQAKRSDLDLAAVIRSGGGVSGLSTAMPPWGRTLSERDVRNLTAYIRILPSQPE